MRSMVEGALAPAIWEIDMKIYSFWRSLATYRVRIALNLKGIVPDEVIDINLMKGQQRDAAFRAVNPMMAIPALVDGEGPAMFELLAIIEYLDETHPNPPLLPKDPKGRARVRGLAQIVAGDSHPLIVPRVREYLEHEFKLDEAGVTKWCQHWHRAALTAIEAHLQDKATGPLRARRRHHARRHLPRQPGGRREILPGRHRAVSDLHPHRRRALRHRRLRPRPSAEAARRAGVRLTSPCVRGEVARSEGGEGASRDSVGDAPSPQPSPRTQESGSLRDEHSCRARRHPAACGPHNFPTQVWARRGTRRRCRRQWETVMGANFGTVGLDWQQRVNWDRLREYRIARARQMMKKHGLGAMLCMYDENVRYITGTLTPGWNRLKPGLRYAMLCGDGRPILFEQGDLGFQIERHSPWLPKENVRHSFAWIKGAAGPASTQQVNKFANAVIQAMKDHGVAGQKLGVDFVDINMIQVFKEKNINWVDGMTPMMEARAVKSVDEQECFRIVGAIGDATHWECMKFLRPGITENQVTAHLMEYLYNFPGMEDVEDVIVSSGPNTWPNWRNFSDRIIQPGDIVFMDLAALTWNGYKSCYYRTYCVGKEPSQEQKDTYETR